MRPMKVSEIHPDENGLSRSSWTHPLVVPFLCSSQDIQSDFALGINIDITFKEQLDYSLVAFR